MLSVAKEMLEAEAVVKVEERDKFLQENCPPLDVPYSREELTVSTGTSNTTHSTHSTTIL